ncbi:MAG: glycosyltransferase [Pseudomonadota bacterium]
MPQITQLWRRPQKAPVLTVISFVSLIVWLYLLLFRHGFWRADIELPRLGAADGPLRPDSTAPWPALSVVIPARDEAETIKWTVLSHLNSSYPGHLSVFVVDDHSTDGTATLAAEARRLIKPGVSSRRQLEILEAPPLPDGWTGKVNAMAAGVSAASCSDTDTDYFLFCDADILFEPSAHQRLVEHARLNALSLTSVMAKLDARGPWASYLVPAFIYFFQKLYPFRAVNDPTSQTEAAAGGCMLVKRTDLELTGGLSMIKDRLIDDCALASQIKKKGAPSDQGSRQIWLGHAGNAMISFRDNRAFSSIWSMVSRTAFVQLNKSWIALVGCVIGMAVLYAVPPVGFFYGLLFGHPVVAVICLTAWLAMATSFVPTLQQYSQHRALAALLPLAGVLYTAMTIDSALATLKGEGGRWKGRTY